MNLENKLKPEDSGTQKARFLTYLNFINIKKLNTRSNSRTFVAVKNIFNILSLLFILVIALPQEAFADHCASGDVCHLDMQNEQGEDPCGSSTCHCICCGSITIILLKNVLEEPEAPKDFYFLATTHPSFHSSNFLSTIWQPPRLG